VKRNKKQYIPRFLLHKAQDINSIDQCPEISADVEKVHPGLQQRQQMELDGLPSTVTPLPAMTLTFDLISMSHAQVT